MMIQVELSQADFGPSSSVLSAISEHCRYLVVSHLLLYETFWHFGALKWYFTRLDFLLKSQMGGYFGPERSGNVAGKHRHTHHYYHCLLLFVIIILIIHLHHSFCQNNHHRHHDHDQLAGKLTQEEVEVAAWAVTLLQV